MVEEMRRVEQMFEEERARRTKIESDLKTEISRQQKNFDNRMKKRMMMKELFKEERARRKKMEEDQKQAMSRIEQLLEEIRRKQQNTEDVIFSVGQVWSVFAQ
jgi:hypothetical protein